MQEQQHGCAQLRATPLFQEFASAERRAQVCGAHQPPLQWIATRPPGLDPSTPSTLHPPPPPRGLKHALPLSPQRNRQALTGAPPEPGPAKIDDLQGEAQARLAETIQRAALECGQQPAGVWAHPAKPYVCMGAPSLDVSGDLPHLNRDAMGGGCAGHR